MLIKDANNQLKKNEADVVLDSLLEDLDQTANGPEIDQASKELKNDATVDKVPEAEEVKIDNADVFPADEHEQAEEAKDVVVESDQVANGPEIDQAPAELKDEATEKGEATEAEVKVDNADVYPSDEHEQAEEAKEAVVTEANVMKMMKAVNKSIEKGGNATAKAAEKSDKANNAAEGANRIANGENKTVVKAETKAKDADAHTKKVDTVSNNAVTRRVNNMGGQAVYDRAEKARANINKSQLAAEEAKKAAKDAKTIAKSNISTSKWNAKAAATEANANAIANAKAAGKKDAIKTNEARKKAARKEKNIFKKIGKRLGLAEEVEIDLNQVSEYELMKVLDESGYEPSIENVKLLREDPSLFEDELETNPAVNDAEVAGVAADAEAPAADVVSDAGEGAKEEINALLDAEPAKEEVEEASKPQPIPDPEKIFKDEKADDELSESMKKIFSLVDSLNENLSQTANGPEINSLNGELKDDATTAGQATETEVKINNTDVFPADEHEQSEEAKEVVVTEENVDDKKANEKIDKEMRDQARKNIEDQPEGKEKEEAKAFAKAHPELFESEQIANSPEIDQAPAELKDEATEKGEATEAEVKVDNADVYPADEHKQEEEAKEVVVTETERDDDSLYIEVNKYRPGYDPATGLPEKKKEEEKEKVSTNESEQVANGPEIDQPVAELKDEATEKGEASEEEVKIDNADVFPADEHDQAEEEKAVEIKEDHYDASKGQWVSDSKGTGKKDPDLISRIEKRNSREYGTNSIRESDQIANGPEINQPAAELKDEATEKGEGTVKNPEIKNADIYCDCTHTSVNDVVGVVVESVREVKAAGEKATIETITEAVRKKLKTNKVVLDDAKAEKKAEKINESVQYNSLREACLLDEDYFQTDSYIKETATEKVEKLTEQVALLIAREQNDPMYDELLKESAYVMRLQEALVKKYKKRAEDKNRGIIGMGGSGLVGHADQDEKRS